MFDMRRRREAILPRTEEELFDLVQLADAHAERGRFKVDRGYSLWRTVMVSTTQKPTGDCRAVLHADRTHALVIQRNQDRPTGDLLGP